VGDGVIAVRENRGRSRRCRQQFNGRRPAVIFRLDLDGVAGCAGLIQGGFKSDAPSRESANALAAPELAEVPVA